MVGLWALKGEGQKDDGGGEGMDALCFLPPALHSWDCGVEARLQRSRASSFVFTPNKASVQLRVSSHSFHSCTHS
ncbi:hypothetical protein MUK42_35770 [Musa troglodytarum]|uniref:Uncharacterized protein n=1 Tax=Musa troglodytarum TaxID=320322 RepID=A0A9E7JAD0_9LILI|nr:hypothetical protein MUK42_35770 [Musa troglodytarum]